MEDRKGKKASSSAIPLRSRTLHMKRRVNNTPESSTEVYTFGVSFWKWIGNFLDAALTATSAFFTAPSDLSSRIR